MDLTIAISVFAPNQNDFSWGNWKCTAGPKWILHSNCKDCPCVFLSLINFNSVVDFLLGTSEETSKSVDKLVVNRAGAQVVSFVFHHRHLSPLILLYSVFFHRIKPLFARKTSENKDVAFAHGNSVSISGLVHGTFIDDFILDSEVEASILFRWGPAASNQDFVGRQSNCCWALVKLGGVAIIQLFDWPFILIDIIAERNLRVYVVSKQEDLGLVLRPLQS